jgi:adenylate cyclase
MQPKIRLSISSSFILLNTFLIVMTGLTVMFFSFTVTKSSIYTVADNLLSEIAKSVLTKTQTYLLPAERAARSVSWPQWHHRLDTDTGLETLLDYYQELLQNNAEFKMVYSADTSGNLVIARRMPDGSLSRRYVRRQADGVHMTWKHSNIAYYSEFKDTDEPLETAYDPRQRNWYKDAVEKKGLVWSEVYIFATDRQPGITCTRPHYDSEGTLLGVTAVDVSVLDLSYYLGEMQVTEHSRLFITDATDRLIALQMRDPTQVDRLFRKKLKDKAGYDVLKTTDIGDPVLSAVVNAYHQRNDSTAAISLVKQGGLLHALVSPLTNDHGIDTCVSGSSFPTTTSWARCTGTITSS